MATPAPSQFAALLRRSKFASFDPQIGQVYTTFDGHAARGNFGLKRPLALRRRNAHITVQAVDSREQQTVWKSGEQQNRWIRMWDEVGVRPKLERSGNWLGKLGPLDAEVNFCVDSEFTRTDEAVDAQKETEVEPAEGEEALLAEEEEALLAEEEEVPVEVEDVPMKRSHAVPNLDAMSETEFDQYLVRIRSLRSAFREFLEKKYKNNAHGGKTLFQHSLRGGDDFREFLESHAYREYHKKHPRYIEQQPHRYAGLSYTHTPDVQTLKTTKPHIGRILGDPMADRDKFHVVAFAGMTSKLFTGGKGEETDQVSKFRLASTALVNAPDIVGVRPQGLGGASVATTLSVHSPAVAYKEMNPHTPGTREYVAHTEKKHADNVTGMTAPPKPRPKFVTSAEEDVPARKLLSALQLMSGPPA